MAQILSRLFNYTPDQYLLLANEEWCRPLPHLGDWQRIRMGILIAVRGNVTSNVNDASLMWGLASGRWNTFSAAFPNNVLGTSMTGAAALNTTRNLAYSANSNNPIFTLAQAQAFTRYVNPTTSAQVVTATNYNTTGQFFPIVGTGIRRRRMPYVMDISRAPTTGVYSFSLYFPNDTTSDWRIDQLLEAVDSYGTPVIGGLTWAVLTSTIQASELSGAFDTFCVYWSNLIYPLELYGACASLVNDLQSPQPTYPFGGASDIFFGPTAGTVTLSQLNTGTGWVGPYTADGTSAPAATFQIVGTSSGIDDSFEQYNNGTILQGVLNGGTNWTGPWFTGGTYPSYTAGTQANAAWYGTYFGPNDTFDTYGSGSVLVPLTGGTGWAGAYNPLLVVSNGTTYTNFSASVGLAGTSILNPFDDMESYALGTVTTPMGGGYGWASYGTIYAF